MPRPKSATGRPNTPVIVDGWQDAPAAAIAATLSDAIKITSRATGAVWVEERQQMETVPGATVYEGPAAVTAIAATNRVDETADEQVSSRLYEIRLPLAASGVAPGMSATVTGSADPDLVGRTLTVTTVEHATRRFSRIVIANLTD